MKISKKRFILYFFATTAFLALIRLIFPSIATNGKATEVRQNDDFPPQEEEGIWLIKEPNFRATDDCEPSEDDFGQKLIAFAQQLKKNAAAQKTGASGLQNANG